MSTELQPVALGFDGVAGEEPADGGSSPTDYTVQFTPASGGDTPKTEKSEEIGLLEEGRAMDAPSPTEAEKVEEV